MEVHISTICICFDIRYIFDILHLSVEQTVGKSEIALTYVGIHI